MSSPSESPRPALGELARRVTMQEIEHRRDVANARAETHEGSPDYWQHCEERDFWFNVAALVALATGGAEMRDALRRVGIGTSDECGDAGAMVECVERAASLLALLRRGEPPPAFSAVAYASAGRSGAVLGWTAAIAVATMKHSARTASTTCATAASACTATQDSSAATGAEAPAARGTASPARHGARRTRFPVGNPSPPPH